MYATPLVVAATRAELEPAIPVLDRFEIPYLITGVGMVATAYSLTRALASGRYNYVLNVGIAGSLDQDRALGEVVEVIEDVFSELGAEDNETFLSIDELGFGQGSWAAQSPEGIATLLPQVKGLTVNTVHGCDTSISALLQRHPDAVAESMEGAAVFYVCTMEKVPCIQVRAISNYVEARNRERWDIPSAVKQLNSWLTAFLVVK